MCGAREPIDLVSMALSALVSVTPVAPATLPMLLKNTGSSVSNLPTAESSLKAKKPAGRSEAPTIRKTKDAPDRRPNWGANKKANTSPVGPSHNSNLRLLRRNGVMP